MKIAVIADPLDNQNAGVHSYTRHMVNSLIENRGEHEIIVIREKKDPELEGCTQIAVPNVRWPIGYASLRLFFIVPCILRKLKVDAVIEPAHFGPFNLPSSIRRVTMIHDLTPILFPQWHRWHSQMLQRLFLKRILRRADIVLSNSDNTSADIIRTYPFTEGKVHTIKLGVDPFYQRTEERDELDKLGIGQNFFHFVGTIEPRKDLPTLLEAFDIFKRNDTENTQLVVAGGWGWKSEDVRQRLKDHPYRENILVTGFVDKVVLPQLHSHSISLIYPSKYEGFGLPVLECLACGGHVITARNSSLVEVGGDQAVYFNTSDAEQLVSCLRSALKKKKDARMIETRTRWAGSFRWEAYGRTLITFLEENYR